MTLAIPSYKARLVARAAFFGAPGDRAARVHHHVLVERVRIGIRTLFGELRRILDDLIGLLGVLGDHLVGDDAFLFQARLEKRDRVLAGAPERLLLAGAVVGG